MIRIVKAALAVFVFVCAAALLDAQQISNIRVEQDEELGYYRITFDLEGKASETYNIRAVPRKGGRELKAARYLSGEGISQPCSPGRNRQLFWNPLLEGEEPQGWQFGLSVVVSSRLITLQPGAEGTDVWITSVYYGGGLNDYRLVVGGWADSYYSMIKFDLTNLPSNVQSAKIMLFSFPKTNAYSHTTMYLHRITSAWDESTKWSSQPSTTRIGTIPAAADNQWYEIDITNLYNDWKNGTYANYGIQLRPSSTNNAFNTFYSSDYTDNPSLRPKLVINP